MTRTSKKAPPAPIILTPVTPIDRRYRCYPIGFIRSLLLSSPIACGMLIAIHQSILPAEIYRNKDGVYVRREGHSVRSSPDGDLLPFTADYQPLLLAPGDIAIDLATGVYAQVLYLKPISTHANYQVNVRLISLDAIPTTDDPIFVDLSYYVEIESLVRADNLLIHASLSGAYALQIPDRTCPTTHIRIRSGSGIDSRLVPAASYRPPVIDIGSQVCWDESGEIGIAIGLRLDDDEHGFYQLSVRCVRLICHDDALVPDDIASSIWLPYQQLIQL